MLTVKVANISVSKLCDFNVVQVVIMLSLLTLFGSFEQKRLVVHSYFIHDYLESIIGPHSISVTAPLIDVVP